MDPVTQPLAARRSLLARTLVSLVSRGTPLSAKDKITMAQLREELDNIEVAMGDESARRYAQVWRQYLRHGLEPNGFQRGLSGEERSIFNSHQESRIDENGGGAYPGTPGGQLAPVSFHDQVESAMKYFGPMLDPSVTTIYDTQRGTPMGFPADDDASITGEMVAEDQQVTDVDPPVTQVVLKSYKFSSKMVKLSVELAQDSGFPIDTWLAERLGIRLARIMNTKFTTGVGTTEPFGFITQAAVGATAVGSASNTGSSESGGFSIGTADLATLEQSVDPAYRSNASYMMHADTLALLRQLVSKQGLPVFPGLQTGGVDQIFGYNLLVNNAMSALYANRQANSPPVALTSVAFGNFKKFVVRRAPLYLRRLDQKYADYGLCAYLGFWRADSSIIDGGGGAIKTLVNLY